ncbi:MAG: phosphoribosylformylglycinamidine synthase subunit PurL [Alphaproteobacteria bacterium]
MTATQQGADGRPADLMGLSADEYDQIVRLIGRAPNHTELGIFSVMWSEHCSYKSSRKWLGTLPISGPQVIQGPGENAGIVDIGDGQAVAFKIESHNHPSFIEPVQGAATGVGGILRDVFTMGARPIAILDALRFGSPDHPRTRHLVSGVVHGIGYYGNCIGVPTVGGECQFDPSYNGNILVNAMAVGLVDSDRIFRAAAAGLGNPIVYVGSKTGRDGIHGATMASAEFDDDSIENRPTVQVGDPFTEKLLLEACLELMATDAIVAIQDMGAAGLTSSTVEMAAKGGLGVDIDLDRVPTREPGMTAYELMLSESQERMLIVLKPGREAEAQAIFARWELDFAVIGTLTDTGRLVLRKDGATAADLPLHPLVEAAPVYDRPFVEAEPRPPLEVDAAADLPLEEVLRTLVGSPDLSSRRWIWEQYDHMVMGDTVGRPGGDAAVVRVHGTVKALALTTDCNPHYCAGDPYGGAMQAVAEAWRNLCAVGAQPLAATNNLNFGNPQRPEIMGQIVGCIRGMAEACRTLDFPIVSGNVSLYNETNGEAILPTPVIGGVGLLADLHRRAEIALRRPSQSLLLVGGDLDAPGWLGQSLFARLVLKRDGNRPPPVNLMSERRAGTLVRRLIGEGMVGASHDVSDGGVLVAVVEMMLAGGQGASLNTPGHIGSGRAATNAWLFGEDQGRYVIATDSPGLVQEQAAAAGVAAQVIGISGGDRLTVDGRAIISTAELRVLNELWLPRYMGTAQQGG